MAHFYADIQGNRGEATRTGTTVSGIKGHIRGWNVGIRVVMVTMTSEGDTCFVYLTGGSNGKEAERLIGAFTAEDLEKMDLHAS